MVKRASYEMSDRTIENGGGTEPAPEEEAKRQPMVDRLGVKELRTIGFWRAVGGEAIGTFLLVYIACTIGIDWDKSGATAAYLVKVAIGTGLTLMIIVETIGQLSGANVNPAVTLGLCLACRLAPLKGVFYFLAQIVGSLLAAALAYGVTPSRYGPISATVLNESVSPFQGMVIEMMITFILVFTVLGATDSNWRERIFMPGIPIGLALTIGITSAGGFTGASINPARSFGPAVVVCLTSGGNSTTALHSAMAQRVWEDQWLYWVGPLLGAILAAVVYQFVIGAYFVPKRQVMRLSQDEQRFFEEMMKERSYDPHWNAAKDIMTYKLRD